MSVNKDLPHVMVLPEDRANRQLANGFRLGLDAAVHRKMGVLGEAGGWIKVLDCFESDHVRGMRRCATRFIVLLMDFDGDTERLNMAKKRIPEQLTDRVFILGALTEPEQLKRAGLGTYEEIGLALARDCREDTDATWAHDLLRHNAGELARLREQVRPIPFSRAQGL